MVSKKEFKLLKAVFKGNKILSLEENKLQLISLIEDGYLIPTMFEGNKFYAVTLTEKGQRAIEDYKRNILTVILSVVGILVAVIGSILSILIS